MIGMAVGDADWFGLLLPLGPFLGRNRVDRVVVFLQPNQCVVLEELGWPYEEYRDSQADACRAELVPSRRDGHGACGIVLYLYMYQRGGTGAIALGIGGLLGIIMMANVHAIIWPNQRRIIAAVTAAAQGTPAPPEMAQWGRTALLASRVNFMLSIPMLLFMGAGSHLR